MSGGSQNTMSQSTVPGWLQPYLTSNLNTAQGLEDTGQFAGQPMPVAPLSGLQNYGLNQIGGVNPTSIGAANSALTGLESGNYLQPAQQTFNASNPQLSSEASGSLLNASSNPYLSGMYNLGLQGIQNQTDSQFGAAGRNILASAPLQTDQASTLADSLLGGQYNNSLNATLGAQQLAGQNYNSGVTALNQGAAVAPGVTAGQYIPGQALMGAGATTQAQAQNVLNSPYNTLSWYSSLLSGNASPFGQTSSQGSSSPSGLQYAGLGIGAAGLGASLYGLMSSGGGAAAAAAA